jgi:hypothetical protein
MIICSALQKKRIEALFKLLEKSGVAVNDSFIKIKSREFTIKTDKGRFKIDAMGKINFKKRG